jgi:hypothetical protein
MEAIFLLNISWLSMEYTALYPRPTVVRTVVWDLVNTMMNLQVSKMFGVLSSSATGDFWRTHCQLHRVIYTSAVTRMRRIVSVCLQLSCVLHRQLRAIGRLQFLLSPFPLPHDSTEFSVQWDGVCRWCSDVKYGWFQTTVSCDRFRASGTAAALERTEQNRGNAPTLFWNLYIGKSTAVLRTRRRFRYCLLIASEYVDLISLSRIYLFLSYSNGLRSGWPGFESQQGQDISLLRNVQACYEAHPASYSMSTGWG